MGRLKQPYRLRTQTLKFPRFHECMAEKRSQSALLEFLKKPHALSYDGCNKLAPDGNLPRDKCHELLKIHENTP